MAGPVHLKMVDSRIILGLATGREIGDGVGPAGGQNDGDRGQADNSDSSSEHRSEDLHSVFSL